MKPHTVPPLFSLSLTLMLLGSTPDAGAQEKPETAAGRPKVFVADRVADLGEAFSGQLKTHTFLVENRGDATLRLGKLYSKCRCVTPSLFIGEPRVEAPLGLDLKTKERHHAYLEPGETAEVRVEFDTRGMPARPFEKVVAIRSDDPHLPALELTLLVDIVHAVQVTPRQANFGDIIIGQGATTSVSIVPLERYQFEITSIESRREFYSAEHRWIETEDGQRQLKLDVTLDAGAPLGRHADAITLNTDHPEMTVLKVPVIANIMSTIRVDSGNKKAPDSIRIRGIGTSRKIEEKVDIINGDPSVPYVVQEVIVESVDADQFSTMVDVLDDGNRVRIYLRMKDGFSKDFVRGRLVVRAEHPIQPEIVIPFRSTHVKRN